MKIITLTAASILFFSLCHNFSFAQKLTKKLITNQFPGSAESYQAFFDKNGNYFIRINETYRTKTQSVYPNSAQTLGDHNDGNCEYLYIDSYFYYKNYLSANLYGPFTGKPITQNNSGTRNYTSCVVQHLKKNYCYFNDKLLCSFPAGYSGEDGNWCSFSDKGDIIYRAPGETVDTLFINNTIIDTCHSLYDNMCINYAGQYIFSKGQYYKINNQGHFHYTLYHGKRHFRFFKNVSDSYLNSNGGYYFMGSDTANLDYLLIDDHLYKGLSGLHNIQVYDSTRFLFTYLDSDGKTVINANGNIFKPNYEKIDNLVLDGKGNFSCFGLRNYYLYKFTNGKENPIQLSKYGLRGDPLSIDAAGNSVQYYATDDSSYFFYNDSIIYRDNSKNFTLLPFNNIIFYDADHLGRKYYYDKTKALSAIAADSFSYFIFNTHLSEKMPAIIINNNSSSIIDAGINEARYFVIFTGRDHNNYIVVNGQLQCILKDVEILPSNCFFTKHHLIFYCVKNHSFYQYKLSL